MINRVDVYYDGWGEHWHWGTLLSTSAINGRPLIVFEYSDLARSKGLELSGLRLPLNGSKLRKDFPDHQMGLPGLVYDSLPDGWGMLLMDRVFKRRGLNPARMGALERLTFIGSSAMGAMSFEPVMEEASDLNESISLAQLASEIQEVLIGEGGAFLEKLLKMGGSPQGARPKLLLYRDAGAGVFSTVPQINSEAWLIKFPAYNEPPEVCAVEAAYAECLRTCGIATSATEYFDLKNGQAAFATRRFDRQKGLRIPMQSLAAYTHANYKTPGALDYENFLRATQKCTNDLRQSAIAFERAVFNVAFNNRDDHPKNFAYLMSPEGGWALAPAYDVTFCEGSQGYHQMDVKGEAFTINRKSMLKLGESEAEISSRDAGEIIDRICEVASRFTSVAKNMYDGQITRETLHMIQSRINDNIKLLR